MASAVNFSAWSCMKGPCGGTMKLSTYSKSSPRLIIRHTSAAAAIAWLSVSGGNGDAVPGQHGQEPLIIRTGGILRWTSGWTWRGDWDPPLDERLDLAGGLLEGPLADELARAGAGAAGEGAVVGSGGVPFRGLNSPHPIAQITM